MSGRGVADALRSTYSNVVLLELDTSIGEALRDGGVEVVFPVLHGPPGEDGTFQGFLEILGVPYVGSAVHASACAMDKILAKHLFRNAGLPVARDTIIQRQVGASLAAKQVWETFGSQVVVKPSRQGSALGVRFPRELSELEAALEGAFSYDERVLVEERVEGREITVGILERNGIEALPVLEVRTPSGSWYDFEHRYTQGLSEHIISSAFACGPIRPDTRTCQTGACGARLSGSFAC
jgi:D-alanine-D-alanine ligase